MDGDAAGAGAGVGVGERGAGESDVVHVAGALVGRLRREEGGLARGDDVAGLGLNYALRSRTF